MRKNKQNVQWCWKINDSNLEKLLKLKETLKVVWGIWCNQTGTSQLNWTKTEQKVRIKEFALDCCLGSEDSWRVHSSRVKRFGRSEREGERCSRISKEKIKLIKISWVKASETFCCCTISSFFGCRKSAAFLRWGLWTMSRFYLLLTFQDAMIHCFSM